MKTYEEMAESALSRIEEYRIEQNRRKQALRKKAMPVLGFCAAAAIGVVLWQSDLIKTPEPTFAGEPYAGANSHDGSLYSQTSGQIEEKNAGEAIGKDPTENPQPSYTTDLSVKNAAENSDPSVTAELSEQSEPSRATIGTSENAVTDPKLKANAQETVEALSEGKIESHENSDPELKSAEAFYGDVCRFWWKNKLIMYGDLYWALNEQPDGCFEIIASYHPATANITSFVYDGKTLADWAVEAFEEGADNGAMKGYKLAFNAYLEEMMPKAERKMTENGFSCKRHPYSGNCLEFTASAAELENLPLDDINSWYFSLATEGMKGASAESQPAQLVNIVDLTEVNQWSTDSALEEFFSDADYTYYFPSIKSEYVVCYFSNGETIKFADALECGKVTVSDLDTYGIGYWKKDRDANYIKSTDKQSE